MNFTLHFIPSKVTYEKSLLVLIRPGCEVIGIKCYYSREIINFWIVTNASEKPTQERNPDSTRTQTVTHANPEKVLKPDFLGQAGPSHPSPKQGSRYGAKDRGSVKSGLQRTSSRQTLCKDHISTFSMEFLNFLLYPGGERAGTHSLHSAESQGDEMMGFIPNLKQ